MFALSTTKRNLHMEFCNELSLITKTNGRRLSFISNLTNIKMHSEIIFIFRQNASSVKAQSEESIEHLFRAT